MQKYIILPQGTYFEDFFFDFASVRVVMLVTQN